MIRPPTAMPRSVLIKKVDGAGAVYLRPSRDRLKCFPLNNQEAPMSQQIYHGVIQGGQVRLLDAALPLPEGTPVLVTALPTPVGTGAAVIAAADAAPRVPAAWIDELEQLIYAGERSADRRNPFAERSSG
jgi:hypothetical protein